jgi:hypothetical protein
LSEGSRFRSFVHPHSLCPKVKKDLNFETKHADAQREHEKVMRGFEAPNRPYKSICVLQAKAVNVHFLCAASFNDFRLLITQVKIRDK